MTLQTSPHYFKTLIKYQRHSNNSSLKKLVDGHANLEAEGIHVVAGHVSESGGDVTENGEGLPHQVGLNLLHHSIRVVVLVQPRHQLIRVALNRRAVNEISDHVGRDHHHARESIGDFLDFLIKGHPEIGSLVDLVESVVDGALSAGDYVGALIHLPLQVNAHDGIDVPEVEFGVVVQGEVVSSARGDAG